MYLPGSHQPTLMCGNNELIIIMPPNIPLSLFIFNSFCEMGHSMFEALLGTHCIHTVSEVGLGY